MHDLWTSDDPRISALQHLTRACVNLATQTAEAEGSVTLPQMRLLLTVAGNPGASGAEIGHELAISPSAVSRMADRLADSGHLERRTSPASRRVVVLELTDHGRDCVAKVLRSRALIFDRVLAALGDDVEAVMHGIERLGPALTAQLGRVSA